VCGSFFSSSRLFVYGFRTAQSTGAAKVVGVDIDDTLVRAAWRRRRFVWSSQSPHTQPSTGSADTVEPLSKRSKWEQFYFPMSCEHMFGPLPIPSRTSTSPAFPYNVLFRTADWIEGEIPEDKGGYDIVLASVRSPCQSCLFCFLTPCSRSLSISKWIHLNKGDSGITRFFERVFSVLKPGGSLVLEHQAWDTYAKAKRIDKVRKTHHLITFVNLFTTNRG
jgi:7SK snRNA methylphosphate capping enzyme